MNSIFCIHPYLSGDIWMFDDESRSILREPFLAGADTILSLLADGQQQLTILFSAFPFPGSHLVLEWIREEMGGNVYRLDPPGIEGWLCPTLFDYFPAAPQQIHMKVIR